MAKKKTLRTYTGREITFLKPKPSQISILDIAHALSQVPRFTGQLPCFYSVAEHAVHCSRLAEAATGDIELALACLLHDASEAYLSDVPLPVKNYLPDYCRMEDQLLKVVFRKWKIGRKAQRGFDRYDKIALCTEFRDLLNIDCKDYPGITSDDFIIKPLNDTTAAECRFLSRYTELMEKRNA